MEKSVLKLGRYSANFASKYFGSRSVRRSHMLLEIPPKFSVSGVVGYLKGKSSLMIYEKFSALQYKYRNREFWCRGYYVDTVGKNTAKIAAYIKNQLKEDQYGEQLTMLGKL